MGMEQRPREREIEFLLSNSLRVGNQIHIIDDDGDEYDLTVLSEGEQPTVFLTMNVKQANTNDDWAIVADATTFTLNGSCEDAIPDHEAGALYLIDNQPYLGLDRMIHLQRTVGGQAGFLLTGPISLMTIVGEQYKTTQD